MATVVVLVTVYYVLPLRGTRTHSAGLRLAIGLLVFVALAGWQVWSIFRAEYPVLRAVQVLALLVPLFLLTFAGAYYTMANSDPRNFSAALTRTDALYFTVTVFATVGFGDIVAVSQPARIAVTLQMVGNILVIGVLVQAVVKAAGYRQRQRVEGTDDLGLGS